MEALWADLVHPAFWVAVVQIIGIDLILAGDNAVVIAMACRTLPPKQRFWGIILGAGAAVLLRIAFTLVVSQAMALPFLKIVGGLLLLWVAIKLLVPDENEGNVQAGDTLWRAVRIIVIADIVMSLDNVIAIAAAAETAAARVDLANADAIKAILIIFGLAVSVPLIVAGSTLLMTLLDRFPILIWAGAGLLGWISGSIIAQDVAVVGWLGAEVAKRYELYAAIAGVLFVLGVGYVLRKRRHQEPLEAPLVVDPPQTEFPSQTPEQAAANRAPLDDRR